MMNIITWDSLGTTLSRSKVTEDVKLAAQTAFLTREILNETKEGASVEDCIRKRMPATPAEEIHEAATLLEQGVGDSYKSLGENVTESDIVQRINSSLEKLNTEQRVAWLTNWAALLPNIDEQTKSEIEEINAAETKTEVHVERLLELSIQSIKANAEVYQRSAVEAADKYMQDLTPAYVQQLAESGVNEAKAAAGAYYIVSKKNNAPETIKNQPAYSLGVLAASNIEGSKLLVMYKAGKVQLEVLKAKLVGVAYNAMVTIATHPEELVGRGVQVFYIYMLGKFLARVLLSMNVSIWPAIIIGYALSGFIFGDTQAFVDVVNDIAGLIDAVWNMMKKVWNALVHHDAVDAAEQTDMAAVNDEESEPEEEEDEEPSYAPA